MKRIFLYLLLLLYVNILLANNNTLLLQLDYEINKRSEYEGAKEKELLLLEDMLHYATSKESKYQILGKLFDAYRNYDTNESLKIAHEKYQLALSINNYDYINDASMNIAETLCMLGMFKESLEIMDGIKQDELPGFLLPYYFHTYRTIYGLLADFVTVDIMRDRYLHETNRYRDSIVAYNQKGTLPYVIVKSDSYNFNGDYNKAICLIKEYLNKSDISLHDKAILYYTLSESYRGINDKYNEKKYLILSSIGDIKSVVREYVSLRRLAVMLYEEGDIDRAYKYVTLCMDDAVKCNARWRILEVQKMFPIINESYHLKEINHQKRLKNTLLTISVLSLCLIVAIVIFYFQKKKITVARLNLIKINNELSKVNSELKEANQKLIDMNKSLTESNYIKEEYVGHYLNQCSVYLDKIEQYRHHLNKIASAGKLDDLYKLLKSSSFIEAELKDFYTGFDTTFLQIYPNFVDDFNSLLTEPIQIKQGELLNTELRIFALIRLGITDSVKIAQFLRYSVTTIYNYRTRIRNRAAFAREDFENKVMNISK